MQNATIESFFAVRDFSSHFFVMKIVRYNLWCFQLEVLSDKNLDFLGFDLSGQFTAIQKARRCVAITFRVISDNF